MTVTYHYFVFFFFFSIFLGFIFLINLVWKPLFWKTNKKAISIFLLCWFLPYFGFVLFFTGPRDFSEYPSPVQSPFKLPWSAGVSRFVIQGNGGFTTHRDLHFYAWDFLMPNGTEVLAAREGVIDEVVDSYDGIGFNSNYIHIKHSDGTFSGYAHIQIGSSKFSVGQYVKQGEPIALSGMVGQTIMPHLHFYVLNRNKTESIPISFADIDEEIPIAGRVYTSQNHRHER